MRSCSLLRQIAAVCQVEIKNFGGIDFAELGLKESRVHASALEYFRSSVPDVNVTTQKSFCSTDIYRLLGRNDLVHYQRNYVPSCDVIKAGFVTIASDTCGDAIAVDVKDGSVYSVEHEISWAELFEEGPASTQGNRKKVILESYHRGSTIEQFLESWLDELIQITTEEAEFRRIATLDPKATDKAGDTLLIHSVREGDLAGVKREIERGAELDHFGSEGRTALGEAIAYEQLAVFHLLLASGADPRLTNNKGQSPLMIAAMYQRLDCIKTLLGAGADPRATDNNRRSALDYVESFRRTPEIDALLNVEKQR